MACIAPEIHGMRGMRALSSQSVILGLKKVENIVYVRGGQLGRASETAL